MPFTLAKNAFSIEGYMFRGWTDSSWEAEPLYADEMEITLSADIALYAVWKKAGTPPEDENQFTVTFYANAPNGTVASGTMTPQAFIAGTAQALTKNTFTIEDYTFIGWAESPEAAEATYADGQEIIVSSDTMLYAMWEKEENPNKHTITFNANAPQGFTAQGSMPPQSSEDSWITLAKNAFSVPQHIFKGWATDASSKEVEYEDEEDLHNFFEDLVLYAVWEYWLSVDDEGNLIVQNVDDVPSDVVIPEGATTIGKKTYSGSTFIDIYLNFKSLKIPSSLEYIDETFTFTYLKYGFSITNRTKGLPFKFIVDENNPHFKTNASGNMLLSKDGTELYFVTNSSSDYTIPSTVKSIMESAFIGANIQTIELDGVAVEANFKFQNCTKLTSAVLKNIVKTDGGNFDPSYLFSGCTDLESADLSGFGTVERMLGTFSNCTSLTTVKLPETLKDMDHTFNGCTSLAKFTIPSGVTKMSVDLGEGNGRNVRVTYPKTIADYKEIRNNDASGYFMPSAFGGKVDVTVTCSDGKVIYTADSDEIKVEQNP